MLNYFVKMLDYDRFASQKMVDVILASGVAGKPVEVMAHMLAAQQIWISRCKDLPAPTGPLWPEWPAENLPALIDQSHAQWMEYLNSLNENEVDQIITYKNTAGVGFSTVLRDIIAHVINHGTHHRGQIGALLKAEGVEIPGLDYILYVRALENQL